MPASESTIDLVRTALKHDPRLQETERKAVLRILQGKADARECSPAEAMQMLGDRPRTFWRRVATGTYRLNIRRVNRKVLRLRVDEVEAIRDGRPVSGGVAGQG